jgi:hypothetical protein
MALMQVDLVGTLLDAHKLELRVQQQRIERLEAVLREHGIPLPNEDPALGASSYEHLQACRAVVRGAYELLPQLERLRELVGSGMELLDERW